MWGYFGLECKCDIIILWLKKYVKEAIVAVEPQRQLLVRLAEARTITTVTTLGATLAASVSRLKLCKASLQASQ